MWLRCLKHYQPQNIDAQIQKNAFNKMPETQLDRFISLTLRKAQLSLKLGEIFSSYNKGYTTYCFTSMFSV